MIGIYAKSQNKDCISQFSYYDTLSINGNYVKYNLQGNEAQLEYGNKYFKRVLPEKYNCQIADAGIPKFKWDNHDFIVLKYGCGSPCWGVLILPLNIKDSIKNIMYDLASDPTNNTIVYLGEPDYNDLVIENLKLKTKQMIKIAQCNSAFLGYCIDSISINKKELYYRLAEPDKFNDNKKLTDNRINLK